MKIKWFGKEKPKYLRSEDALAAWGVEIFTGMQLDNRLKTIEKFLDKIKSHEYDSDPIKRMELMATVVEKAIIPYGKGRDSPAFVRLVGAWTRIITIYYQLYRFPDLRQKYLKTLNAMSLKEVYEPFLIMLAVGFSKEDLAKNIIGVIQTMEVPTAVPLKRTPPGAL